LICNAVLESVHAAAAGRPSAKVRAGGPATVAAGFSTLIEVIEKITSLGRFETCFVATHHRLLKLLDDLREK
jgi:hypothetical protein